MQLPLLPLPSPSNFELEEKLFTILDLKDKLAELAAQSATAISYNVDHFMVESQVD